MSIQILGDKKRVRYDESLVDKVNAKYSADPENKGLAPNPEIIPPSMKLLTPVNSVLPFNAFQPSDVSDKTQKEWQEYYQENNMQLMSTGEFYEYAEWLKQNEYNSEVIKKLLDSESSLITDSSVHYAQTSRRGIINVTPLQRNYKKSLKYSMSNDGSRTVCFDGVALNFSLDLFNIDGPSNDFFKVLEYVSGVDHTNVLVRFEKKFDNDTCYDRIVKIGTIPTNSKHLMVFCDISHASKGKSLGVRYKK